MRDVPLPPRFASAFRRRGLVHSLGLAYALMVLGCPFPDELPQTALMFRLYVVDEDAARVKYGIPSIFG